jgi:hypothetical protein
MAPLVIALALTAPPAPNCDPTDPTSLLMEHLTQAAPRRRNRSAPVIAMPLVRELDGPTAVPAPETSEDDDELPAFPEAPTLGGEPAPRRGAEFAAQGPSAALMVRPPELSPDPVTGPTPEVETTAAPPAAPPGPTMPSWLDRISLGAFADVYANVNYNFPQPQSGRNFGRTMETTNGFALAWLGADMSITGEHAGGTISLRFGPGAANYAGPDNGSFLQNVKQGFAWWKPKATGGKLSLEIGKFDSPFGLEVGDSQLNMHYTRPTLYTLGQPFFHTGMRLRGTLGPKAALTLYAVNGWNNSIDNNLGKSFGAQLALTPHPKVGFFLGYLGGPENSESATVSCGADTAYDGNGGCTAAPGSAGEDVDVSVRHENRVMRHLVDLVTTLSATEKLSFGLNGDFVYDRVFTNPVTGATARAMWLGGFLSARYAFTKRWALAGRGEYFQDVDGLLTLTGRNTVIGTGTVNVDFAPVEYLLIRLEQRVDHSNNPLYQRGPSSMSRTMITTTLGVVVRS